MRNRGTLASSIRIRLVGEYADGEWHDFDDVADDMVDLITPRMALTDHERRLGHTYKWRTGRVRAYIPRLSVSERVQSGRRQLVMAQARHLAKRHQPTGYVVEYDPPQFRITKES